MILTETQGLIIIAIILTITALLSLRIYILEKEIKKLNGSNPDRTVIQKIIQQQASMIHVNTEIVQVIKSQEEELNNIKTYLKINNQNL